MLGGTANLTSHYRAKGRFRPLSASHDRQLSIIDFGPPGATTIAPEDCSRSLSELPDVSVARINYRYNLVYFVDLRLRGDESSARDRHKNDL